MTVHACAQWLLFQRFQKSNGDDGMNLAWEAVLQARELVDAEDSGGLKI